MNEQQLEQTLQDLYDFIEGYICDHRYPPSLREIAAACYLGRSTVLRYLTKLEAQGRITRVEGKARSIALVKQEQAGNMGQTVGQSIT